MKRYRVLKRGGLFRVQRLFRSGPFTWWATLESWGQESNAVSQAQELAKRAREGPCVVWDSKFDEVTK